MNAFKLNIKFVCFLIFGVMIVQSIWLNRLFAGDEPIINTDIRIIIKETGVVTQSNVFLGDIADIHASGFLKEGLEKTLLGSSPKPGMIKAIQKKKIASVIQGQRYLPEKITFISPERIYVKRLSQTISKQDIRLFVDQRLSQVLNHREYQLSILNVRGLEPYPRGKIRFRPESEDMIGKNGKLSFFLDVVINGKKEGRVNITGSVAVYENVLHAERSYAKGRMMSKETVYFQKENIFELSDNFIKTIEEIDGKILKSAVKKGSYLKTSLLIDPPLIQKGDIITLVSKNKNLLIVTSGISKEDGFENGLIKVENLTSGKLVRGIVKSRSKVEVTN